jgi:hypothetical protein
VRDAVVYCDACLQGIRHARQAARGAMLVVEAMAESRVWGKGLEKWKRWGRAREVRCWVK